MSTPRRSRRKVAAIGEPFRSFFNPEELHALLREAGFGEIEDMGLRQIGLRYLGKDWPEKPGTHILRARRPHQPACEMKMP